MLETLELPEDVVLDRTSPEFTTESVPPGLLREHQIAKGVWGLLRVLDGSVTFVAEHTGETRVLCAPETQVIQPGLPHHVELGEDTRFVVEFHRQ